MPVNHKAGSALERTDSLDPTTTCKGVTGNGRPCRRPLASSTNSSPAGSPSKHAKQTDAGSSYCWQHKDQAPAVAAHGATHTPHNPQQLKPRTSVDTLMDRLGVLEINDSQDASKKRRNHRRRTDVALQKETKRTLCCCFEVLVEDDDPVPSRPANPAGGSGSGSGERPPPMQQMPSNANLGRPQRPSGKPSTSSQAHLLSPSQTPSRPSLHSAPDSTSSNTKALLSWIPPSLSPQATSALLSELAKPISDADEPGYIYMFWVTPATTTRSGPPPADVARSLLPTPESRARRTSDAIQTARGFSTPADQSAGSTIRLKIGRTSNVNRRLTEWSRQCSHDLTLIRYYPYSPGRPEGLPPADFQEGKVPHVHRVERLTHLELGDLRLRDLGKCEECGKEHREWFEVPADKAELTRVDECIRRWVKWAESQ